MRKKKIGSYSLFLLLPCWAACRFVPVLGNETSLFPNGTVIVELDNGLQAFKNYTDSQGKYVLVFPFPNNLSAPLTVWAGRVPDYYWCYAKVSLDVWLSRLNITETGTMKIYGDIVCNDLVVKRHEEMPET